MPFITVNSNVEKDEKRDQELCLLLSSNVATLVGKPEAYVMT